MPLLREAELQEERNNTLPPLCIEAHTSISHTDLERLAELCSTVMWKCVLWLRWRQPLQHYLSFFAWGVLPKLVLPAREAGGAFLNWMRVHTNLQSELLIYSGAAVHAIHWNGSASVAAGRAKAPAYGWKQPDSSVQRRLVLTAVSHFHTFGTVDGFEASARHAFGSLGWPVASADSRPPLRGHCRNTRRWWWCFNTSLPAEAEAERVHRTLCPDPRVCEEVSRRAAPLDYEVHERAKGAERARQQQSKQQQPEPRQQMEQHASLLQQRDDGRGGSVGGGAVVRDQHRCAWIRQCRRCVRKRSFDLKMRLASAPRFDREARRPRPCFTGTSEVLRLAWLEHPYGGRVMVGAHMGRLVTTESLPAGAISRGTAAGATKTASAKARRQSRRKERETSGAMPRLRSLLTG